MNDYSALHKKLQLKPGTQFWLWPETTETPQALESDDIQRGSREDADVAIAFTNSLADVNQLIESHLDALAPLRAVWFIYPKGNAADFNRDSLWNRLLQVNWRANSNVAYSETLSAIRARPLKPGETVRQS